MKILIVEDEKISRSILNKMLVEMGHTVVEAEDGEKGWEILKSQNIKIVISDWMMPGLNGLELCRRIRSEAFKEYIYLIMLTAKDAREDLVEVFKAGADDYIPKPFDPEELRARVMTGVRVIELESRHKAMTRSVIESRNKVRIVFDALVEDIVSLDRDLNIISINKTFASHLQCSPEQAAGKNCFDRDIRDRNFLCDDNVQALIAFVFEEGIAIKEEHKTTDSGGSPVYRQISCLPIKDEAGQPHKIVIVSQDITEERRKSEEINRLNAQLLQTSAKVEAQNAELKSTLSRLEETQAQMIQSEKMASIGQLAAGVAHEINNPTGFVSSNLKTLLDYQSDIAQLIEKYHKLIDTLQNGDGGTQLETSVLEGIRDLKSFEDEIDIAYIMEDINDLIGDCREGTERIKKIVIDLKDFAHPGEDTIQTMDINNGLESTLNVVNNEIKYKATVKRDFGDIPPIKGYPQQINQVFMNILVNAAQAIEAKGEITVRTEPDGDHVKIIISDTGCGIPPENLNKIFDPFFTTKDIGKGTGLGMNIAYNIVTKHKGTIEAASQVGKGTAFIIKLPVNGFTDDGDAT